MIMLYIEPGDGFRYRVLAEPLDANNIYVRSNNLRPSELSTSKPTAFSFGEGDNAWTGYCFYGQPDCVYATSKLYPEADAVRLATQVMAYLCLCAVLDMPFDERDLRPIIRSTAMDIWFAQLTPGWDEPLRTACRDARERLYSGTASDASDASAAPGHYGSFAQALDAWESGRGCRDGLEAHSCRCLYSFPCTRCSVGVRATGDGMPEYQKYQGMCADCGTHAILQRGR